MKFDDKVPIYYQIKQYIYQEILINHFQPGTKIPPVRQLAIDLTVNVNTIQRALSELIDEGILISKRGKGNFVTTDLQILNRLKENIVEEKLEIMYTQLKNLQISSDEMVQYLSDYIKKREENDHE